MNASEAERGTIHTPFLFEGCLKPSLRAQALTGQNAQDALRWLKQHRFVHITVDPQTPEEGSKWKPLDLGLAACASGLTPEQALMVHKVLQLIEEWQYLHVLLT